MAATAVRRRVVIMGAAGRDFHDFNMLYRDDPTVEVVAFTATQIPGIENRRYPPGLAGPLYPEGIPIRAESELDALLRDGGIDTFVFAYSDIGQDYVMHAASRVLAAGADFLLPGPARTMLRAKRPVIAVSAVRTGCGKSQTARWLSRRLKGRGLRVAAIRHPMPYGDLARQAVQRFETPEDLAAADCTIEEREEYEPHIAAGTVVFAGVDYAGILAAAEAECDILLWDGGNNDMPFLRPDLHIVLADARRPGDEAAYHPGEAVLRMADIVVIAKTDTAPADAVAAVALNVARILPGVPVVRAASPVTLDDAAAVRDKRVLIVEDGPTVTHGGLPDGAGMVAARAGRAGEIVDPRPFAAPVIRAVYERYPHIGPVLPAVGYGAETEGMIGYLLEQALMRRDVEAATLLTQVVVDRTDRAFRRPSKPIGPVYDRAEGTAVAAARGWRILREGEGWRRVVPSPAPIRVLEMAAIRALLAARLAVICAGGGGVPVIEIDGAGYIGVEAVIDKDATSALLARELDADKLLLLTDIDAVYDGWGLPEAAPIASVSVSAMRRRSFAPGSMAPKVAAACAFVAATGRPAAIGAMEDAAALAAGTAGTRILPDSGP